MLLVRFPDAPILADLLHLAEQMHADSQYAHIPFCRESMIDLLSRALACPDRRYVAAVVVDGETIGGLIGVLDNYSFNNSFKVASDFGLFVLPQYRNARVALNLISDFERWAGEHGASHVVLGSTALQNYQRVTDFYSRYGYRPFGALVRKEL